MWFALQDFGKNIYTLKEVVEEIRDKSTRRSLAFLPYQLTFREPHPEHLRHGSSRTRTCSRFPWTRNLQQQLHQCLCSSVTEFSKRTGDYPSLSATDLKVLALTYQLELEHVGSEHLRTDPAVKVGDTPVGGASWTPRHTFRFLFQVDVRSIRRHPETPVDVAGFHLPSKVGLVSAGRRAADAPPPPPQKAAGSRSRGAQNQEDGCAEEFSSFLFWRSPPPRLDPELLSSLVRTFTKPVSSFRGRPFPSSVLPSRTRWRR